MDFRGWVEENLQVESSSGAEYTCGCPMCGRAKLAVNVERKAFQCWVCGFAGWRPVVLVAATLDCEPHRAAEHIATESIRGLSSNIKALDCRSSASQNMSGKSRRFLLPTAPAPPGTVWNLVGPMAKYAAERNIPADHARWFGLGSVLGDGSGSKADRLLRNRLLIPVWDQRKTFVYWVARATSKHDNIKTLNLPDPTKHEEWGLSPVPGCATRRDVLVGLHLVSRGNPVVVVEGPMDAVVCGPGFVATMGSKMTRSQAFLLASTGASSATILFDPDEAGRVGAIKAHELLSAFMPTSIAQCPSGLDPAELGRDRALDIVAQVQGSHSTTIAPISKTSNSKNLNNNDDLRDFSKKVREICRQKRQ